MLSFRRSISFAPVVLASLVFTVIATTGLTGASPAVGAQAEPSTVEDGGTWLTPVPGFHIVRAFEKPEQKWSAGHRGIDVAALPDEPVRSPGHGTVRFAGPVAGHTVVSLVVDGYVVSFDGVDPTVSEGDTVFPGTRIGTVSSPSHCTDGCVHIGVWKDAGEKDYLNPAQFFSADASILLPESHAPESLPPQSAGLDSASGAGAWGGHSNGRIPLPALCTLRTAPGHSLRCDAAESFDRLSMAFQRQFGHTIAVTDSYRSYEQQVILKKRKGRMAATPGRSNHGWGLALDLGSGINIFGSEQHAWMRKHAPSYGWIHPGWARQSGSLPEAWHWEYGG